MRDRPSLETNHLFDALGRINCAIVESTKSEDMLADVLEQMLDIFSCDRAWLLYPCSLSANTWTIPMERTRPEYPGAGVTHETLPVDDYVRHIFLRCLESDRPVAFDTSGSIEEVPLEVRERFGIRSQLLMAIRPKGDEPWALGIHDCRRGRTYEDIIDLFMAIGGRVADGLTTHLAIGELRESQERLAQSQKMEAIGQLTGGVAHDFNNLLTIIFGSLELLEARPDSENVLRHTGSIRRAAERASGLTHRLLAFARKQPLKPTVVDIWRLLQEMDELLRRTLGEDVEIEMIRGGGLWQSEIDPVQLENAVLNLAINARDAMPDGGRLTIEVNNTRLDHEYAAKHEEVRAGQYVMIAVTDSGTGIPEEILQDVFSPFFTTKDKGKGKGSGLGLSMVYGFVKQSGGHIKVYSEVGVGTTMRLYLPRSLSKTEETFHAPPKTTQGKGAGERILVVEDEEQVRRLTVDVLRYLNYQTLEAGDAKEAMALILEHPELDMLLTDVVLPGGTNGAELAREAQVLNPKLSVVFMSGYTENAIIHNGRLDTGVDLIEKPFTMAVLATRLREVLDRRSPQERDSRNNEP